MQFLSRNEHATFRTMFHYTDGKGFKSIGSQPTWKFRARRQRKYADMPHGAYFTTLPPDTPRLCARIRISREKRDYVFQFAGAGGLEMVNDDRGYIYYSKVDYLVEKSRQIGKRDLSTERPGERA